MKAKHFPKKLELNKTTVSNLGKNQMNGARGGFEATDISCPASKCAITCADSCILCNEPRPSLLLDCLTDLCPR